MVVDFLWGLNFIVSLGWGGFRNGYFFLCFGMLIRKLLLLSGLVIVMGGFVSWFV